MNRKWVEAAALIIGLPLFLLACERDISERGSGKKVAINFAVGNEDYSADQQIMKGAGAKDLKQETVYVPLDDTYFLAVTLRPEPAEETGGEGSQLRATPFLLNQKIRFMAFNGSVEVGSAVYTWNGSQFVADDEPLGVEPDNGVVYRFVAYSFYGDPTEEPSDTEIEPWQDLVWGAADSEIHDTEAGRTVQIVMKHKFSRAILYVDVTTTGSLLYRVSDVEIEGSTKADFSSVRDGTLVSTPDSEITATFENTGWTPTSASLYKVHSAHKILFPSLTKVNIGTLQLASSGGYTAHNLSASFTQTLAENASYQIWVDVRMRRFAQSNIYWVSTGAGIGYLMFDKTLVDPTHQYYQGVFFKYGSLVGMGVSSWSYGNVDPTLYIPPSSGTDWISSYTSADAPTLWPEEEGDHIPYNYTDVTYTGDICNRIDNDWRLPKMAEWGVAADYGPFVRPNWDFLPTKVDGTALVTAGHTFNSVSGIGFLPAGGWLYYDDDYGFTIQGVGEQAFYWSISEYAYYGWRSVREIYSEVSPRESGLAPASPALVRCIKKSPGES
jgi:hypothetical protein